MTNKQKAISAVTVSVVMAIPLIVIIVAWLVPKAVDNSVITYAMVFEVVNVFLVWLLIMALDDAL